MANLDCDVILASLKLARAMRRCPPEQKDFPFPPAIGRLLACTAENPGVSSRDLCVFLDLRPSSLSEMLSRAEADGLLVRETDPEDRRVQRVTLSDRGAQIVTEMNEARDRDAQQKTSCFSEEEKKQFITLCNRLSEHIGKLSLELPEDRIPRRPPDGRPPLPPGGRFRC